MSTDLHDRTPQPSDEGPDRPEKPKPALSVAQVVGGALAAMTAAALGSRLSLAGTVVGAALASVVAAVAGAVYTSSLRRTSQHVTKVISSRSRAGGATGASQPAGPAQPSAADPRAGLPGTADSPTEVRGADPDATRTDWSWDESATRAAAAPEATTVDPPGAPDRARRRLGWKPVVLGALLMFVIAAVVLTGLELATGRALSGGNGTTVGQVADGGSKPTPRPSSTPSATPSAGDTPSATASAEPTPSSPATPSSEPTATPSASETAAPSASPTPSATPLPSTSATPGVAPTA